LSQAARKAPEPSALTLTPGRIAGLLRESWWLGLVAAVIYLAMVLYTFDRADPGWSHSAQVSDIRNAGGALGAWVSDLLLWLFGISAWWWLAFCLYLIWWVYRRLDEVFKLERAHLAVAVAGFLLLLVGSCSLEALRLYSHTAALPLARGQACIAGSTFSVNGSAPCTACAVCPSGTSSTTCTATASSTATSSRRTCCWIGTGT